MTEAEWLTTADPSILQLPIPPLNIEYMLKHVHDRYAELRKRAVSDRKLRLFACACCHRHWSKLSDAGREVVRHAEEFAEGRLTRKDFTAIRRTADIPKIGLNIHHPDHLARVVIEPQAIHAAYHTSRISYNLFCQTPRLPDEAWSHKFELAALTRDIFGNPFRLITADPQWLTETVVALATGIYTERAFDRMPILADALEDAGCDNHDILNHLRGDEPHVKGCWALDVVFGKS